MADWTKTLTEAYRHPEVQKHVDEMFHGRVRLKISREQHEEMIVKICAIILESILEGKK